MRQCNGAVGNVGYDPANPTYVSEELLRHQRRTGTLCPHGERHNGTKAKVTKPTHWRGAVSPCATSTLRSRVRYAALGGCRHFLR
jgi:hypothetical protein